MNFGVPPRSLAALGLMALSSWLAAAATPRKLLADLRPPVSLTAVVPSAFGGWREDASARNLMIEPALQHAISAIYAQTISRTYVNGDGERIMLAVAYGRNQSDSLQVHLPEGCYQGQGFAVDTSTPTQVPTSFGAIPAQRMVAQRELRREAVTYWVVVGNRFATDEWQRRKIKLSYALARTVPDGILIRVSSIGRDSAKAFSLQQRFIDAMLAGVPAGQRRILLGERGSRA